VNILTRIIDKLKGFVAAVEQKAEEVVEVFERRRAASLAEKLDELAATKPYKNWRASVEDLAYLVGEDGSFEGRKALWADLACHGEYKGTAAQNRHLHAALLEALPDHGIPWPGDKPA